MITIDCPLCAGPATTDDMLARLDCSTCDVSIDVAMDAFVEEIAIAA